MAIAALDFDLLEEAPELPWPRPVLRVVPSGDGWEDEDAETASDDEETADWPEPAANRLVAWAERVGWNDLVDDLPVVDGILPEVGWAGWTDDDVDLEVGCAGVPLRQPEVRRHGARRAMSAGAIHRYGRALALCSVVIAALVLLALPLRALAASPSAPASVPAASSAPVYVVQPGDTVWSIAEHFDGGGDPRPLASAIARQTGSDVVVPGERIAIP